MKNKQIKNNNILLFPKTEFIFRDITHGNISIKKGIEMCDTGKEVGDLIRMLAKYDLLNESMYNKIMSELAQEGKLDKFK